MTDLWNRIKRSFGCYPPCPHKKPWATVKIQKSDKDTFEFFLLAYGDEMTLNYDGQIAEVKIEHHYLEGEAPEEAS